MANEYIYRVTRQRSNPGYYKSANQTGLHSKRSLSAILKYVQEVHDNYVRNKDRWNLEEPKERVVKIERAKIGPFEDVTSEYLTPAEAENREINEGLGSDKG